MTDLRLLFAAPCCLLDRSSGAAQSVLQLLQRLPARGIAVEILGATLFDTQAGAQGLEAMIQPSAAAPGDWLRIRRGGLEHVLLRSRHWRRGQFTALEEARFEARFRRLLQRERPDALLLYGGMVLERLLLHEARRQGLATLFYLANPSYRDPIAFRDVAQVVTDTAATAELYRARHGLQPTAIGKILDPAAVRPAARQPATITFVNPSPEKGAALVVALARRCRELLPEARFLVVESRGRWAPLLERLEVEPEQLAPVELLPLQDDMRPVFARTRVLLLPSYWHESGSRLALEAVLNGIPVLAAAHGGIAEVLDGAGELIAIPQATRDQPLQLPQAEVLEPWLAALQRLLRDPVAEAAATARALEVAARYDPEATVSRFEAALRQAVASVGGGAARA